MLTHSWINMTLRDVQDNGPKYVSSLINDYERYVHDFGYISVFEFIQGWTCITYRSISDLSINDKVYDATGQLFRIASEVYDGEKYSYVYADLNEDKDATHILISGTIYSDNVIHKDYYKKVKNKESEEQLCPILITKINQHQN